MKVRETRRKWDSAVRTLLFARALHLQFKGNLKRGQAPPVDKYLLVLSPTTEHAMQVSFVLDLCNRSFSGSFLQISAPFAPLNHEEAEIEMKLSHANQFLEFCLIEDRHTEFSRLVVLRPRISPDHNIIRLFAHRTDHLAAMLQHNFAGFFPRTIR
jgi:hypothetical protein